MLILHTAENNHDQTYDDLLAHLREILVPKYEQKPQISCTIPLVGSSKSLDRTQAGIDDTRVGTGEKVHIVERRTNIQAVIDTMLIRVLSPTSVN